MELLPPGEVRPEGHRRGAQRGAVIDGEVTGELPRVVDGEVTGEMPALTERLRAPQPPPAGRPPAGGANRKGARPGAEQPDARRTAARRGKRPRRGAPRRQPGAAPGDSSPEGVRAAGRTRRTKSGSSDPKASRRPGAAPRRRPAAPGTRPGRKLLRQQLRDAERLRLVTLAFVTLVLLGSIPGFFLIKQVTRDPAFRAIDALQVPAWAARRPVDSAVGNRWCVRTCRIRQRMWESDKAQVPTVTAYQRALGDEGWKRWDVKGCPPQQVRGDYSCWRHDEYTLDLWVRGPDCRGRGGGSAEGGAGGNRCPASVVTVRIRNAGADARLR